VFCLITAGSNVPLSNINLIIDEYATKYVEIILTSITHVAYLYPSISISSVALIISVPGLFIGTFV
jgi:hypothetical protein